MALFSREKLFEKLAERELGNWVEPLRALCDERFSVAAHGKMPQWIQAWHDLPSPVDCQWDASTAAVRVARQLPCDPQPLRRTLMQFHPWRKGPFDLFGLRIDTEWQSNLKWDRFATAIDFHGKTVLDIGCGNGYYGWKMIDAGAELVIGCDPFLLYALQFEVLRRYSPRPERHFLLPLADHELPPRLQAFEVTCSLGVLYHRVSPIEHLQTLWHTLTPDGQLLLETLVVDAPQAQTLVPEGRYAKMRNVWFIPTISMLQTWLRRTGFRDIRLLDVSTTTPQEQRRTEWMTYESLADFLDPSDAT
ncbi:MAG: tRNA 5-methoxyuridine(34)/uridine 5-oxyacetic acid(34) synthase CmoB, partial [Planctomycetales bacterium]|nr:tRNA 5-methoxyuridine(34)/uridine 5-oxyacetic acid(34) synthase CmoB [Planctomycetales bacterium]